MCACIRDCDVRRDNVSSAAGNAPSPKDLAMAGLVRERVGARACARAVVHHSLLARAIERRGQ